MSLLHHEVIVWRLRQNIAHLRLDLDALERTLDDVGVSPPEHEALTEGVVAEEDPINHIELTVDGGEWGSQRPDGRRDDKQARQV